MKLAFGGDAVWLVVRLVYARLPVARIFRTIGKLGKLSVYPPAWLASIFPAIARLLTVARKDWDSSVLVVTIHFLNLVFLSAFRPGCTKRYWSMYALIGVYAPVRFSSYEQRRAG